MNTRIDWLYEQLINVKYPDCISKDEILEAYFRACMVAAQGKPERLEAIKKKVFAEMNLS